MAAKRKKRKINYGKLAVQWIFVIILMALTVVILSKRSDAFNANEDIERSSAEITAESVSPEAVEPAPIPEPTPSPSPTPEPEPEMLVLSFIGDNSLWANSNFVNSEYGLPKTVGDDYAYPYKNTVQYFEESEFTLANLECTLSDETMYSDQQFSFLAPSRYANILVEGHVDFVTMANNHTMDFYEKGLANTKAALDAVNIPYGNDGDTQIVTTPSGLKLGILTAYNSYHPEDKLDTITSNIKQLRSDGADIVICMFHWGQELYYSPNENQTKLAHACIDAGADIVYGSHPHCLQPIEEYNGRIIMYSVGNWVFGGNTQPSDPDTAIVQVTIKRDIDGTISYDGFNVIPCCISSNIDGGNAKANNTSYDAYANYNDYCPTPYEEDSEGYLRALSKLMGTFEAKSEGADYSDYYASWG